MFLDWDFRQAVRDWTDHYMSHEHEAQASHFSHLHVPFPKLWLFEYQLVPMTVVSTGLCPDSVAPAEEEEQVLRCWNLVRDVPHLVAFPPRFYKHCNLFQPEHHCLSWVNTICIITQCYNSMAPNTKNGRSLCMLSWTFLSPIHPSRAIYTKTLTVF